MTGRVAFLLLLCTLPLCLYLNTLHSPFIFDDSHAIRDNPNIRISDLAPSTLVKAGFSGACRARPVANISFALDYLVNQRLNLVTLHLTNIAIHTINGLLLFSFILLTFKTPVLVQRYADKAWWTAALAALTWVVHPLHTQSVTYLVQRMNSMAVLFFLLAFICYILARFSSSPGKTCMLVIGGLLSALLSFGSKEISATLPCCILLYEWFFFQDCSLSWLRRKAGILFLLFVGVVALFVWKFGVKFTKTFTAMYAARDFTLEERLLTEPRVVLFYVSLLLWPLPSRMNLEHDFPLSTNLVSPWTTLPALLFWGMLLLLALILTKRYRLEAFTLLWLMGNLVIESTIIPLEIIFEHRTYLPSMMLMLLLAVLAVQKVPRRTLFPAAALLVLLLSLATIERNHTWRDEQTLLEDCVSKSPEKPRPNYNLGNVYGQQGNAELAIKYYRQALKGLPNSSSVHTNLGIELMRIGHLETAIKHFTIALDHHPDFAMAHFQLGIALTQQGQYTQAIDHFTLSRQTPSLAAQSTAKIIESQLALNQPAEALAFFDGLPPDLADSPDLLNNAGVACLMLDQKSRAKELFQRTLALDPANRNAQYNLHLLNKKEVVSEKK
ncbi:MAG: hypothetical protein CSA34_03210 [Desulfobulbus propionicus]|nr:MAG: hypothetical protein CSA34_03210 [Desulfobulbus propionicus]